jgi:squalene cyclase
MATTQNFFRAFVVHPDYSKSRAIQKVVDTLAGMQRRSGSWQGRINSYLTINALGHLDIEGAESQIVSALRWLKHTQNRDGSWGRSGKEWKTFLIIHAIRKNSARVNTPHS